MTHDQDGRTVGADGHEAGVTEGEEPGETGQNRHAEDGDDVNAHQDDNTLNIGIDVQEAADGVVDAVENFYHNSTPPLCLVLDVDTKQTARLDEEKHNQQREGEEGTQA